MSSKQPLIVVHRRNEIAQLDVLPQGCWIEIDVEIFKDKAYLTHDPITGKDALPDLLEDFVPKALENGVAGFVVDCKREAAEKWVKPIFEKHDVTNYFYLNEMEVQADIFQSLDPTHNSGIRIWKYHSAPDIIRMAKDIKAEGGAFPKWVWYDCWQRGLLGDIMQAYMPTTGEEACELQAEGVQLCVCSPELYVHVYNTDYTEDQLNAFYKGTITYRKKLIDAGITPDAVCTKFPHLWLDPIESF